jgi:glycerophosphoryl diester phosphodiesterase
MPSWLPTTTLLIGAIGSGIVETPGLLRLALLVGGMGLAALQGSVTDARSGRTLLAAHRGGALLWPENSLLAFRNAIALGADFLELDVHLSEDGEPIVIHDPTLDRTTTGTGPVRDLTLAELRRLRLKDRDGRVTDEAVPALEEVLALAVPPLRILLEIKADARRARYPGIEEKLLASLDRRGIADRAIVMAFEEATVRRLRELRPDLPVGALYSARSLERAGSTVQREIEALRPLGVRFVGLQPELVTPGVVEQTRRAGLLLGVWTVNEPSTMRRFNEMGVDIVVTDRPDLAKNLFHR